MVYAAVSPKKKDQPSKGAPCNLSHGRHLLGLGDAQRLGTLNFKDEKIRSQNDLPMFAKLVSGRAKS